MQVQKSSWITYSLLAYFFSWVIWAPAILANRGFIELPEGWIRVFGPLGTFGPFLAVLVMIYREGRLKSFFLKPMNFRFPWYYWLIALSIWPAVQGLGLVSASWYGDFTIEPSMYISLTLLLPLFFKTLVAGGPLGEEFGWRAYALPSLLQNHGPLMASLILGIVHAFWHLPAWLAVGELAREMPFWLFAINVVSQTPIYTWLYLRCNGSIWPVILFHTTQNMLFFHVFSVPYGMVAFAIFFYAIILFCVISMWKNPNVRDDDSNSLSLAQPA